MNVFSILLLITTLLLTAYCFKLKLRQKSPDEPSLEWEALPLQVSNNDVMQHIREIAETFKPLMDSKSIAFSIKCAPESMMGWADSAKTDVVMSLLLTDIVRNATPNAKVTLDVRTNDDYDRITLRISDNGPQLGGLGLLIAHHLVRLQKGVLRNEYYEGQGNTIVIEQPIRKDAYQVADEEPAEQPAVFNIPSNIKLTIPTIELPEDYIEGQPQLGAIIQQAYVSADQEFVKKAVQCVRDHITDTDYDRETFAADMGSSVSTLYNKLRATTGKSVTNFVRDVRIKEACRLAKENPDLRISDIAYRVGFKDPKYFATSFKRVMGTQPKEYFAAHRPQNVNSPLSISNS